MVTSESYFSKSHGLLHFLKSEHQKKLQKANLVEKQRVFSKRKAFYETGVFTVYRWQKTPD